MHQPLHMLPLSTTNINIMRSLLLVFAVTTICQGQNAADLQRASVAKQMASIQKQRETARPARPEPVVLPIQPIDAVRARPACPPMNATELNRMIEGAAAAGQVEPEIIREVARQESAFYPCAVSPKGAEGLMQLMPATQAMLGVDNPYDPEQSLWAGARLLKTLLTRYGGDLSLALSAYNAGPARVDAADGIPAIPETQNYVASILNRLTPIR